MIPQTMPLKSRRPRPSVQVLVDRYAYLWSLLIVITITAGLWVVQQHIAVPDVALIYLLGIFLCSTTTSRWPALLCAGLSFIAFKFFFVPPVLTMEFNRTEGIFHLVIFIVTGLGGAAMAVRVREQAQAARQRVGEVTAIYELSQAISAQLDFADVAPTIAQTAVRLLPCAGCCLQTLGSDGVALDVVRIGTWPTHAPVKHVALQSGSAIIGSLQIVLDESHAELTLDQERILQTLAGQASLALERARLAQEAAQTRAFAESDRLKSTLLSAVSHDFRTPLALITAAADEVSAKDVHWSQEAVQEFSLLIRTEAERLNRLVINLLDLTMLEAGIMYPQIGWYNITEIVKKVVDRLMLDLSERPLELIIPDDLPLVPVDFVQIEQVLWNILQNTLKYSPPESPITIRTAVEDQTIVVSIGDRGPGIPAHERAHVFEKFYRLPEHAGTKTTGTGIGLAICKGLIDAHGGDIRILDHAGGGTVVEICLPLHTKEGHDAMELPND